MTGRAVVIVQARMGSSRLPGKVLLDLAGAPMLDRVLARCAAIPGVDEVVVATSQLPGDDPLADHVAALGLRCFRGSESDVLSRYAGAARMAEADLVMRVTSDCPLLDPAVSGRVLAALRDADGEFDYVNNTLTPTYPRGLDTEAFTAAALYRADAEATLPRDREHVTPYLYLEPGRFRVGRVSDHRDNSHLRWTVDTQDDLDMVRALVAATGDPMADYETLLATCSLHPEIVAMNATVQQKQL